jgi:hypothetical protein
VQGDEDAGRAAIGEDLRGGPRALAAGAAGRGEC